MTLSSTEAKAVRVLVAMRQHELAATIAQHSQRLDSATLAAYAAEESACAALLSRFPSEPTAKPPAAEKPPATTSRAKRGVRKLA